MTLNPMPPEDLAALAQLSARLGQDPLLIQAAGGNTSTKDDADGNTVMWIKASGLLLGDALQKNIFVPVDLCAMQAALDDPAVDADKPVAFALGGAGLRPSIETSLHAVFSQKIVVHVHCVRTIAIAIRKDAQAVFAEKLRDFDWAFVPYVKPGANLARLVRAQRKPTTDVVILGNHGLIIVAETVPEAQLLLAKVVAALDVPPAKPAKVDMASLEMMAGTDWSVPDADNPVHQLALDPARMKQAAGGSLYPDHVIFCGIGAKIHENGPLPHATDEPVMLIVPEKGVVMRRDASEGAKALARCLGEVLMRVPPHALLNYFTAAQNDELINWDAEKYRKTLNA